MQADPEFLNMHSQKLAVFHTAHIGSRNGPRKLYLNFYLRVNKGHRFIKQQPVKLVMCSLYKKDKIKLQFRFSLFREKNQSYHGILYVVSLFEVRSIRVLSCTLQNGSTLILLSNCYTEFPCIHLLNHSCILCFQKNPTYLYHNRTLYRYTSVTPEHICPSL